MAAEVPGMVPLLLLCDFFWGDMNEHLCIPGKALMRDQRFCSYLPWPVSKLGGGSFIGVWKRNLLECGRLTSSHMSLKSPSQYG